MKQYILIIISLVLISQVAISQKEITVESIWQDFEFFPNRVPGFNFLQDGRHFTRLEDNTIKKYDIISGSWVEDIFNAASLDGEDIEIDGYHFNHDESAILIEANSESIYRRSYLANYYVYDFASEKLTSIYDEGKVMNATFSPDGTHVAYVWENNLYYFNIDEELTLPVTFDGETNSIINGVTDWVYEEEFSIVKAFWWSPDSKRIAYLRFDESEVPEFTMTYHKDQVYPEYYTFKYPKVGEKNADVTAHVFSLASEESEALDLGDMNDIYIPRAMWTTQSDELCVFKMNRHQNHLELFLIDTDDNSSRVLLEEKNEYYIDIHDNLNFLKDGKHFIWTSEKEGYNHIYKYNMDGQEVSALTRGNYDVTSFYGVDEANGLVYYQAAEQSPLRREVYQVNFDGKQKKLLTPNGGTNSAAFSSTYDYYTLNHSTINTASTYTVFDRAGKQVRRLEDNAEIARKQKEYGVQPVEFFDFTTSEGVQLNGWQIKPKDFDPAGSYPVFMFQYSGPGSQQVLDNYRGVNYWWFQMLAQQGYIVACVDGRGTGARGEEFKKMTYLQLGHYETKDQIEAGKYLAGLPFTDPEKVGIFGWSYGGYMSSLCILKGADVFSTAIAVAPVTNWKWYDTIYTERFMRTSEENDAGYRDNSPVYFADQLEGNYLLVHGSGDDNVHLQNSMEMANALIAANKQFDTYIYPNRAHGIARDNARLHLYNKMTNFLNENLK